MAVGVSPASRVENAETTNKTTRPFGPLPLLTLHTGHTKQERGRPRVWACVLVRVRVCVCVCVCVCVWP